MAAAGEATTIIGGHEANAAHATAIAVKLRAMEASVVKTKLLANTIAQETQAECEAIAAMPLPNAGELARSRAMMGLSQNMANVTTNTTELANTLGVPPSLPLPGAPTVPGAKEAEKNTEEAGKQAGQGSDQAMQMLSQLGSMAGQLPQMLMQIPAQMSQPLQQLSQPLQQLTSMFGSGGKTDSMGAAGLPFSAFSNHPLAGGGGAGGGSGMVRAASLPGSGGVPTQTPLMANLVGSKPVSTAPAEGGALAGSSAVAGAAPMAAGGGMGGGMGPMMGGARGDSGGTTSGLAVPAPLDHDLDEDDVDDDW